MAKDFWIDDTDASFPTIRHRSYPRYDPQWNEALSLSEAQKRIKEICRSHRQHWLAVMNYQVDQSRETIIRDAIRARRIE